MPITIGSNIASLKAQRQLSIGTSALSKIFERLSSGMRINHAGDDAAGLSIAGSLEAGVRVYTQAVRNINDGVSALGIAEGALGQLLEVTSRQKELAEQAANGVYSFAQRKAMNTEANSLVDEFNRIIATTTFNGANLLDLSSGTTAIQAGNSSATSSQISFSLGTELDRAAGTGAFTLSSFASLASVGVTTADVNSDGILDIIQSPAAGATTGIVSLGRGDGTFQAGISFSVGIPSVGNYDTIQAADFNGDGKVDLAITDGADNTVSVVLGNGDGSFKARSVYAVGTAPQGMVLTDVDNDGKLDLIAGFRGSTFLTLLKGNGDGTFAGRQISVGTNTFALDQADFNMDGITDLVVTDASTVSILRGMGDGTFTKVASFAAASTTQQVKAADVNRDGYADLVVFDYNATAGTSFSVYTANGDGTFNARISYATTQGPYRGDLADMNGDGILDVITGSFSGAGINIHFGNSDGTFKTANYTAGNFPYSFALGDFNRDGAMDIVSTTTFTASTQIFTAVTRQTTSTPYLNLYSRASALNALDSLGATIGRITSELASIGSAQSRLDTASNALQSIVINYRAAAGRITDTDIAQDSSELIRQRIIQQAAAAVLAHTDTEPSLVLKLLGQ